MSVTETAPALGGIWLELEAILALMDRHDPLGRAARARSRDGELTYAAAWAWLRAQEGEAA